MSILSTNQKLIKVGQDYSAGENIGIYNHTISSRNWSPDITYAAESAFQRAAGYTNTQISSLSSEVSSEVSQLGSDIDFISGVALTAHQSLEGYLTKASGDEYYQPIGSYATVSQLESTSGEIVNLIPTDYVSNETLEQTSGNIVNLIPDTSEFITNASAEQTYQHIGNYLSSNALEGYATQDWVDEQGYITGVDLSNYYTKDETSGKEELAQAFADIPVGDPEVNAYVADNSATINGTTDLVQNSSGLWNDVAVYQSNSANYLTAHQDISYKLDESAFADVSGTFLTAHQNLDGYATVEDVESATSGLFPSSAVTPLVNSIYTGIFANTVNYSDKPTTTPIYAGQNTLANVGQIVGSSIYIVPSGTLQVSNIITANTDYLKTPLLTASNNGLFLSSQYVNFSSYNYGLIHSGTHSYFSAGENGLGNVGYANRFAASGNGISYSSYDTNFSAGRYGIYNLVEYLPSLFISGMFGKIDINLTGGSAVDNGGNKKWQIGEADHLWSFANGNPAYTGRPIVLCYAPQAGSANAPYFMAGPGGFTSEYIQNNNTLGLYGDFGQGIRYTNQINKITATLNATDIRYTKYNDSLSANEIWSLTGSVQKREIEYDADTSAITAIAGSAIGVGGVTGEFVPQSAFDELKSSYDALSSLFSTYSGQWLLPNEGEEE